MFSKSIFVIVGLAVAAPLAAQAQVLTRRDVSLQLAKAVAEAAVAQCKTDGFDASAAVVDRAGDLKLLHRADSANPHNADLARRKAYTARTYNVASLEFAKRTAGTSDLSGQRQLVDVIPLGGGLPIRVGTEVIGAIGLSGAPTQEQDEKCAQAGLAAVAGMLK